MTKNMVINKPTKVRSKYPNSCWHGIGWTNKDGDDQRLTACDMGGWVDWSIEPDEIVIGLYIHSMENDGHFVDKMGFILGT